MNNETESKSEPQANVSKAETDAAGQTKPSFDGMKNDQIPTNAENVNALLKYHFNTLLSEPTKYILLVTLSLYFTGFIIWHFYLAHYGVAGVGFLRVEYASAAFCFLFIFFSLSVPPYLFLTIFGRTAYSSGGLFNIHQWDNKTYAYTLMVWYFINYELIKLFLPASTLSITGFVITIILSLFFVLHVCFGSVLFVKAGYGRQFMWGKDVKLTEKQLRFQNSKLFKYGNVTTYTPLYFGLLTIVSLFFNSDIDKSFLFVTMGYWFLSSRQLGISLKDTWPKSGILLRFMICIGVFLSFLLYVNIFSITQFGKIPKGVGGGKPENVYLVFSSQHCGAAESMNLHKVNNLRSTNSIFGPVGIILKTENEITFINYSELNTPKVFTNGFRLIYTTNLAVTSISHTNSNPANPISTNIVDDTRPNVFYNSGGLAARQIRADLIDGIIYSR